MGLMDGLASFTKKILRTNNDSVVKQYRPLLLQVDGQEQDLQHKDDAVLRQMSLDLRQRVSDGADLESVKAEAFALAREVADRQQGIWNAIREPHPAWSDDQWGDQLQHVSQAREQIAAGTPAWQIDLPASVYNKVRAAHPESVPPFRMRAHGVQVVGGAVLCDGRIAELKTGEGKTLVAVFASYLYALTGKGVHIITVNDYLAGRDAETNGVVLEFLGCKVGAIYSQMPPEMRQEVYQRDVIYGTNSEFGFDYLRDNLKQSLEEQVQTRRHFAIVDEVDSVLIDEARVPLIISGPASGREEFYHKANEVAKQLELETHFTIELKDRSVTLTEEGIERAAELFEVSSMYDSEGMHLPHYLDNALKAHHLFIKDKEYMVVGTEAKIVDEFTGRVLAGRRWSEGLHQAVECKEACRFSLRHKPTRPLPFRTFSAYMIKFPA